MPNTQSFLAIDNSSATLRKYDVSGDKLNLIQEWSVLGLYMIGFHRNDQTFIVNLLHDGKTIEIRSVIDGSVVGSSTSDCPTPVSQIPFPSEGFDSLNGFLYWRSLGIWTDVYTGKTLAIPLSFELFVREDDGERIVAIRYQEIPQMIECIIVDTSTDEELLRVRVDPIVRVKAARILKKSGNLALITDDFRILTYDSGTGNLIGMIDPLGWAFWLNCAAAILFAIWCVVFISFAAPIHLRGWIGVRFENLNQKSEFASSGRTQKESSINLRDIFLFMTVSAIVAAIVRWIPLRYWYETWLNQPYVCSFLSFVAIQAAGLAATGLLAMWTCLSRRKFVVRWSPWLIVVLVLLFVRLPFDLRPMLVGASPTILLGLHAYRLRGWRLGIARRLTSQVGVPASAG